MLDKQDGLKNLHVITLNVIEHVKGQENIATDALSRGPNSVEEEAEETVPLLRERYPSKTKSGFKRSRKQFLESRETAPTCPLGRMDCSHVKASANRIGN